MAYNHGREDRKWRIWKEAEVFLKEISEQEISVLFLERSVPPIVTKYEKLYIVDQDLCEIS